MDAIGGMAVPVWGAAVPLLFNNAWVIIYPRIAYMQYMHGIYFLKGAGAC